MDPSSEHAYIPCHIDPSDKVSIVNYGDRRLGLFFHFAAGGAAGVTVCLPCLVSALVKSGALSVSGDGVFRATDSPRPEVAPVQSVEVGQVRVWHPTLMGRRLGNPRTYTVVGIRGHLCRVRHQDGQESIWLTERVAGDPLADHDAQ